MSIEIKRKEAKTLTFTIRDNNGDVLDVSDPTTVDFVVKDRPGGSTIISKQNSDFDKTNAADGKVSVVLDSTDTDYVGSYVGELKITFSGTNIDKSDYIQILIQEAITD